MIKTAGEQEAELVPVDYQAWHAFMKGWIEDFKKTRTSLLKKRAEARAEAEATVVTTGSE